GPLEWLRERVDVLCSTGAYGPLYVFIRDPPDRGVAEMLRWVTLGRRLQPHVIAADTALTARTHLELLEAAGVPLLYITLHGASAATHDARTRRPGSWRRVLLLLTTAPQLLNRLRLGAHVMLSGETAPDVPGIQRLIRKVGGTELLLWDAGC